MLLVIIVAVVAVSIGALIVYNSYEGCWDLDWLYYPGVVGLFIGGIGFVFAIIVVVLTATTAPATHAELQQRREALVCQLQEDMYDNIIERGKFELAEQVREYNETVASGKALQHNLWVGVFVPDIYDDLDLIPLDLLK